MSPRVLVAEIAGAARHASRQLAKYPASRRLEALGAIADRVRADGPAILAANADDLARAGAGGLAAAPLDRLRLSEPRLAGMVAAIEAVAALPDPIGRLEQPTRRPNGLEVARMRIPLGVVAIIYESRPNVTTDAAALCLKSGNAAILRGGSEAAATNRALGRALSGGLAAAGFPAAAVQVIESTDRAVVEALLQRDEEIDVVIPRGGEGLIRFVSERSRIPVLRHYKGVCSVFVHRAADPAMALTIAENAKVQRPGVCNAAETLLIDAPIAPAFVPALVARFGALGVEIRGDARVRALGGPGVVAAREEDWSTEYLDLIVSVRVVDDLEAAVAHIERYGSSHTETIVTADPAAADRFLREVDSSTVLVNASTRFADGGELGLGAEIGISTTRLHAYGPMGIEGLTTTKFVVRGSGQIRT